MTKVICIGGKAQNGKDTSAVVFSQVLADRGNKTLVVHYADLLKFIPYLNKIRADSAIIWYIYMIHVNIKAKNKFK